MLAALLALASATTTVGPELVERFTLDDVRGPFAVGVNEVLVVREPRALERRTLGNRVTQRIELPCDAIDVVAHDRAWAVLCADRVVMERARFGKEVTRQTVELAPQSARPALLAVESFHQVWVVAYEDGLVQRGRFRVSNGSSESPDEVDLRARPVSLEVVGISDAIIALADGTQHAWRGSRIEDITAPTPRTLVELYDDANGTKRARVSRNVTSGSSTLVQSKRGAAAVSSTRALDTLDALDFSPAHDVVCVRSSTSTLVCYGTPPPPPPEIAPRDVTPNDDVTPEDGITPKEPAEEFEAPLDFGTPGAIAALVSTALGVGAFASAPFAMQALSPSLGIAPAVALAGLGAVAGVASFTGVASVVIVVGAIIVAATPGTSSAGNAGVCAPGVRMLEGAINDCICALAGIVGAAGALVATASVAVAALAVAAMPPVDAALGGRQPANDPFFATLGGAAAGGVVGFGVGAGISFVTSPLRDTDDDGEPDDDDLAVVLDSAQTFAFVVAGGALGASIGYGVARGP